MNPRQRRGRYRGRGSHQYSNGGYRNGAAQDDFQRKSPTIVITPQERTLMLEEFVELPKIRALKSLPPVDDSILNKVMEDYLGLANFSNNPKLQNPNHFRYFTNCVERVYGRQNILFSIDVEAYEHNTETVTELGISIYDPRDQVFAMVPSIIQIHIKIKENLDLRNGRFVPDHSDNFVGGTTYVMTREEAVRFTQTLVDYYFWHLQVDGKNMCSLVGHGVGGDIKWFSKLGIVFPQNMNIVDTQKLFTFTQGEKGNSLKNGLLAVKVPSAFLHNAGNDAYYTLILAMKLCDPVCRAYFNLDDYLPLRISYEDQKKPSKGPPNHAELVQVHDYMEVCVELF